MEDGIKVGDFFDVSIFIGCRMKQNCLLDLLAPGQLLFRVDFVHEILQSVSLLLGLDIGHKFDDASVALDLDYARVRVR